MSVIFHTRLFVRAAMCLAVSGFLPTVAQAETLQTDDYIYIAFEAESFVTGDERWVVTDSGTAAIEDDPDANHSDTASEGVYLELLPDLRVTHADPFGTPPSYWGPPGAGPTLTYTVTFPEAGRYYVHGRAYSTGTEDNGVHFGLNDGWPFSGAKMQFCTAGKNAWTWRSSQRDAGGNGSCGIEKTVYLDIPSAGEHTIKVSGREDGFELDRVALIKDKSGNTKICSPENEHGVTCKNGSIESADDFVDLRLLVTADSDQVDVGETINFTATLENLDAFDTATDIEISVSAGDGVSFSSSNSDCEETAGTLVCALDSLAPTTPSENESYAFSMVVSEGGEYVVEVVATSTETDELPENNTVAQSVIFDSVVTTTDIEAAMSASATQMPAGEETTLSVVVTNAGEITAESVTASINIPEGFNVGSSPAICSGSDSLLCTLGDLPGQSDQRLDIVLLAAAAGSVTVEVSTSSGNDIDSSNNSASVQLSVTDDTPDETGGTDGDTGTTDGGTDDAGGSMTWLMLFVMLAALSARLYGLNQRNLVVSRQ